MNLVLWGVEDFGMVPFNCDFSLKLENNLKPFKFSNFIFLMILENNLKPLKMYNFIIFKTIEIPSI